VVLTRGDTGKAEEIVQELCLYFTLTQPDLTSVANLDGYLYTSLRHIYLSGLARSSREAQHFVSVAEFDSFESALTGSSAGEALQRQNDLRRICGYAVWRKESSKSASYFILHFFHGYGRRKIAAFRW
jgi:DNA-directed RNA polymerase specialized sigma24 family protein